jgi:transcriptional activator of cad operon
VIGQARACPIVERPEERKKKGSDELGTELPAVVGALVASAQMLGSAIHAPPQPPQARPPDGCRRVGDLTVDLVRRRLLRGGRECRLPKLSFDLLAALVEAAPDIVSIDSLMSRVWPGLVVAPETVVQRVKLLRAALGDDPKQPRYIEGVRGHGYRVVAEVSRVLCEESVSEPAMPTPQAPPSVEARGARFFPWTRAGVIAAAVSAPGRAPGDPPPPALASAAVGFALVRLVSSDAAPRAPRVAVLPFESLSPNADDAFLADGMQDEVINALAERAPSLGVIARTTMMTYRGQPHVAASTIGRELGVTHVVAATLRRDPSGVRMTVQLVDAKTDTVLWSHAYDRDAADVVSLRSDAAADLVMHLPLSLSPRPAAPRGITQSPEAYEEYLKALAAQREPASPIYAACPCFTSSFRDLQTVEALLTRAIELDPVFADAYAERMSIRTVIYLANFDTSEEQLRRIQDDLAAAEKLGPTNAKTLAARARYAIWIDGDYDQAAAFLSDAQAAGFAEPRWIVDVPTALFRLKRYDEAVDVFRRALALDPKNPMLSYIYADGLSQLHRPADALRAIEFGLAQSPDDPSLRNWRATWAFEFSGDRERLHPLAEAAAAAGPAVGASDSAIGLAWAFHVLTSADQVERIPALLDNIGVTTLRAEFSGVGREPIAVFRGWTDLLLGDDPEAAEQGRQVLEFLGESEETKGNRYFRHLLAAEAHLFMGNAPEALAEAHEAAALPALPGLQDSYLNHWIAAIYAWAAAESEAVELLERLVTEVPVAPPPVVARDPIYTLPLAENPRFQRLILRLEAEMREIRVD